jgi:phosphinothricin acetyltransferase
MNIEILMMTVQHWPKVREIYLAGIAGGNATFEIEAPSWDAWDARHLKFARLVAALDGEVKGWAALSPVSSRAVYRGVAENSVYVDPDAHGRGIGRLLLQNLIIESEANAVWTLQNSIFPENVASINLHLSCGFREVGYRERIAQLNGVWRNTIFMERRSSVTGISDMP